MKHAYEQYKKTIDNIKAMESKNFREISKIINDCSDERRIPISVYYDLRDNQKGEFLLEQLSTFAFSYGCKLTELRDYLFISPITEKGGFLTRWIYPRNHNHKKYISESELYSDTISPLLIYDVDLSWLEFYERFDGKLEEVDEFLKKISSTFVELEGIYTSILESAKELADNFNICREEVKRVWLELKNRQKQIVIKQDSGGLKVIPKFANVVNIKGETAVYSDYEGCTSHVRYEGDIAIYLDEDGKVSSFEDISLNADFEYNGCDDEELDNEILDSLRENFVFDLI